MYRAGFTPALRLYGSATLGTRPKRNLRAKPVRNDSQLTIRTPEKQLHNLHSFPIRSAASAFGELEPLTRALLAVLFPFVLPWVAREKAELLQFPAQLSVELHQGS